MVRVKDSIRLRLEKMVDRYEEIGRSLADPAVIGRQREFRDLSVEYARLTPVAEKFGAFRALERELASARDMQNDGDPAMRDMGSEEIARLAPQIEQAEDALKMLLIPRDPRDDKNIYLEVRAGTGGDEAAIFAGDLFRMYARLRRDARLQRRSAVGKSRRARRLPRSHQPHRGQRRLRAFQVRIRRAPRAARAGHRGAGPHPHLGRDRGHPARARRSRSHRPQSRRAARRHLSRLGRRRPARQQDRLGHPHHAPAHRASWSNARTSARSTRTARAPWR